MQYKQQSTVDGLRGAEQFGITNAEKLGAIAKSVAFQTLHTVNVSATELGTSQRIADRELVGQLSERAALVEEIRVHYMQPIAQFARARLRGVPLIAALKASGRKLRGPSLVSAARAMATAATPHAQEFVNAGFPADTFDQLGALAAKLEALLADQKSTTVGRTSASASLHQVLKDGKEAVAMLHAVISKQFAKDKAFLTAWNSARRIHAKPGGGRTGSSAVAATTPTTPAVVAA